MGVMPPFNPQELFEQATIRQANVIASDCDHVLNGEYILLNSGRRFRLPLCKHNRYKHSFIPQSIKLLNKQRRNGIEWDKMDLFS